MENLTSIGRTAGSSTRVYLWPWDDRDSTGPRRAPETCILKVTDFTSVWLRSAWTTEVSTLQKLKGTGLTADLISAWKTATKGYIILERLPGHTLLEILENKDTLTLEGWQKVLDAVNAVHRMGVCNCDLHPGNIMIQIDDEGKLTATMIDFGQSVYYGRQGVTVVLFDSKRTRGPCNARNDKLQLYNAVKAFLEDDTRWPEIQSLWNH